MNHQFSIDIFYNNQILHFNAALQYSSWYYRIVVQLPEGIVYFEPDEERNLRAILAKPHTVQKTSLEIIQAIAAELQKMFGSNP